MPACVAMSRYHGDRFILYAISVAGNTFSPACGGALIDR